MAALTTQCKCPKCGATVIVDASSDHSTCVWCGTSIPNVLAKESEISSVAAGVQVERPIIDTQKLDESNTSGRTVSETTAIEMPAGLIEKAFSVNALGKLILAVILAPVLALATLFFVSISLFWLNGGNPSNWVVNALVGFCAIGVGAYPIWASVAPFVREQSLIRKVILGVIHALALAAALLLFVYAFTPALGPRSFMLPIRLALFLLGLLIIVSHFGRVSVSAKKRVGRSIQYALAMGAAGFTFALLWGGNLAPLMALFFYGPAGVILGVIIGLVMPVHDELPPSNTHSQSR